MKALGDESETVRWKAAEALSQIGEPAKEIVPVLIKALGDESEGVRSDAALALKKIGWSDERGSKIL